MKRSRCCCCCYPSVFADGLCYFCWSEITGIDLPDMESNKDEDANDIYICLKDSLGDNWR